MPTRWIIYMCLYEMALGATIVSLTLNFSRDGGPKPIFLIGVIGLMAFAGILPLFTYLRRRGGK